MSKEHIKSEILKEVKNRNFKGKIPNESMVEMVEMVEDGAEISYVVDNMLYFLESMQHKVRKI